MPFDFNSSVRQVNLFAADREQIDVIKVRNFIKVVSVLFRETLLSAGYDSAAITRLTTKFRDAGRRSPPWLKSSSIVLGIPQSGSDGNRQNRWLFPADHKYYADEVTATLVEIKYYFQALSMTNAPMIPAQQVVDVDWLLGHPFGAGNFLDPLQLISVEFGHFCGNDRRYVESGHIIPLDRGGRHNIQNSFLILTTSNRMQGSLTFEELLQHMENILRRHNRRP